MSTHIAMRATSIQPRMIHRHIGGVGPGASFEEIQNGWIVNLEDNIQLIMCEKPSFPLIITVSDPT